LGYEHYDARLRCCTAAPEKRSALGKRLADVPGHRCRSPLLLPVSQRLVRKSVPKTDRLVPLDSLLARVCLFVLIGDRELGLVEGGGPAGQ
jgi:hypothetical protein